MQLKSYLRGFGCGLFISAVLMGIAVSYSRNTMTDEEIKLRASELGMVEEDSVLIRPSDIEAPTPVVQLQPEAKPEAGDADLSSDVQQTEAGNSSDTESEDDAETQDDYSDEDRHAAMGMNTSSQKDDAKKEDKAEDAEDGSGESKVNIVNKQETYTLEISKGATSDGVARLLKQGGLIDDTSDFDSYLCRNGYDKRIQNGVFKIPSGAGYEEIAKIITRSK